MRDTLVTRLKGSRRPGVWSAVAVGCRVVRPVSRRKALWSYRLGVALERAGRWDQAGQAFTAACQLAPHLSYELPDRSGWDAESVAFARTLAARGVRYRRDGAVRELFQRRGLVVPVVPRRTVRRWQRSASSDTAAQLHLLYLRHRDARLPHAFARYQRHPMPRGRLGRAWQWYAGDVLIQTVRLVRANGAFVREATGVSRPRQLWDMLRLSVTLPARPDSYYRYELYRPGNRLRADQYLHGHENSPVLYALLSEVDDLAILSPLTDKAAFADRAAAHGLPAVPTLAVVEHGAVSSAGPLPPADLFVKPLAGKRGAEASRWIYLQEGDGYRESGAGPGDWAGQRVLREELLGWLAARSAGQAYLVQPCVGNHPDLADLALDALVTCRIITMTNEAGEPEPVIATFRMPAVPGAVVDNMHRGGIAAAIALDTGELGAASDYAVAGPAVRHPRHPVSGAGIEGRKLPEWEQVRALVCRAHACFQPRVLIGWDVSITSEGPVLLEGNERPGVGGLQRLHDTPLGSHRFGELLAYHLTSRFGVPR